MGVLVDDLVRMTLVGAVSNVHVARPSSAWRLRIDNAAERLMPYAERYGLLRDDARRARDAQASELVH
jgi:tRNA U34 5-carboxymethylaminomethyl modifying enzyme MnmG/GidA